jgi:hypothetical protein
MNGFHLVQFRNGQRGMFLIHLYHGACFAGDPTAYIVYGGGVVWLRPGESVEFIEA